MLAIQLIHTTLRPLPPSYLSALPELFFQARVGQPKQMEAVAHPRVRWELQ